ncbi:hypothetical protein GCM10011367_04300 [Marinicauda pacifica]|nr:hypothetical protein GCM10011367_04300 [Marinicauda pacifica]
MGAIAIWAFTSSWRYYHENRAAQEGAANQYAYYADANDICSAIEADSARLSCIAEQIEARHNREHAESDLQAQLDMSSWTYAILWVGVIGIIVSVGGVALIFETLRETRAMSRVTSETLDETRLANRQTLRAYISLRFSDIVHPTTDKPGQFVILIENHGQTPCFVKRVICRYRVFEAGEAVKITLTEESSPATKQGVVFPGQVERINMAATFGRKSASIVQNGGSAHVAGILIYHDIFGITRRTIFHNMCDAIGPDGMSVNFGPYKKHNRAS